VNRIPRPTDTPYFGDVFRSQKVLITGNTGFKGSWLTTLLLRLGARVFGLADDVPTEPSLFREIGLKTQLEAHHWVDIRDLDAVRDVVETVQPDFLFHLAAQAITLESYRDPVRTVATNVLGTTHVLEALRLWGGPCTAVIITSDKCYENREWVYAYRENDPMGGFDPYSNSKGCAELITAAYRNSFFHPEKYNEHHIALASARAGNVIGGGDWAEDRLIPDILSAISNNRPVIIRNPHAIRPWQHVLEPLSGYLQLAQKLYEDGVSYADGWNFGPNDEDAKPVQWIVEQLTQQWGDSASWQLDQADHPHEAHYLKLDCSKAKMHLAWTPRWNLTHTLEMITAWQHAWLANEDMRPVTLKQIKQYAP